MAFQREVGGSAQQATDYRDLLTKLVAFKTSQHVATVVINNGGTGGTYVIGDIVELTHAGAYLDARFEVLTVAAGQILTMRIQDSGAFSNRIATVAVNAGGSGYVVNDVLEIQGGTNREKGKARVATLSGSAVATVNVFETGGAYSVAPGLTGAATIGVGPSTFAGNDAATLDLTMTGLIGLTGLAVTGGGGTGATVDITLAQTGWAIDGRNTNDLLFNGVNFEKQVTIVGDASGKTNKPYVHYSTRNDTSGINERYNVVISSSIAHNPSISISAQVGHSGFVYLSCDEDQVQNLDFWFSANDFRSCGVTNINPGAANTDDGEYMHFYTGYINTFATESEDPYPMFIFASSRTPNIDPSTSSVHITGLSECVAGTGGDPGSRFFRSEDSTWVTVENSEGPNVNQSRATIMHPMGQTFDIVSPGNTADVNFQDGPVPFWTGLGSTGRASPTRRLLPVPGSTELNFPIPLTIIHRPGLSSLDDTLDTPRGQLDGVLWVYNTDDTGATIVNFSEDYVTIGTDRYRVFHTQVQRQLYHYICIKEDV